MNKDKLQTAVKELVNQLYPMAPQNAKEFFVIKFEKLFPYSFKGEEIISEFIEEIRTAEVESKQIPVIAKTNIRSMADFYQKASDVADFKNRIRNTIMNPEDNEKKTWWLDTLEVADKLGLSVEAKVIKYNGLFDDDIVAYCIDTLGNRGHIFPYNEWLNIE